MKRQAAQADPTLRRGRPRSGGSTRPGDTAAEEILDAAAELFSSRGYAATSTRRIAEAVGVRQASLYHYFETKDHILIALLDATVRGPLALARDLAAGDGDACDALLELSSFDTTQLLTARFNLGALYHLPELASPGFADFRADRAELAGHYRYLAGAVLGDPDDPRAGLPFRLVESVIGMRFDGETDDTEHTVATILDAIRRVVTPERDD